MISAALIAYAFALLFIALASLRWGDSMENFLVAGRKQPKFLIVASMLASTIGGGITIGTVQKAQMLGFAAFWFVAAGAFAHFMQGAFLSHKVRESEALTMAELADKSAGGASRFLTSIIILVTWTGIAAAQFVAIARVLLTLVGLPHVAAVGIAAAFIVIYTLIGRQKSVLRTDLFQFGVLAIALIGTLTFLYIAKTPVPGTIKIELFSETFGLLDLVYYIVVMGGSYFVCPMMFSRLLSANTPRDAKRASFMSGTGMIIFAFTLTFIGLWISATGFDVGKNDPLNALAIQELPRILGVLLVFGLLAAIVSTADTVLLTAASIVQNDIIKKPSVLGVRLWIVAIGAVAAFVALFHRDVIGLLMKTYNGYTAGLVPALTVALFYARFEAGSSKRNPNSLLFALAIVGGYALGMLGSFSKNQNLAQALPLAGLVFSAAIALLSYKVADRKKAI
ncbi:sodium:solute symporter [Treponema sp.]